MTESMTPISEKDTFRFACHPRVRCFNQCCRDLDQYVTPYDILRLKNRLGISSGDFLRQHAVEYLGSRSGLPVVAFRMERDQAMACPFVTKQGCGVYEDRPASCRTYPLARLVSRSRETGVLSERYMLIREAHCCGFEETRHQTVAEWIRDQGLAEYHEMNDRVLDVIHMKNRYRPEALDPATRQLVRLALYDIDGFREYAVARKLSAGSSGASDPGAMDDTALLRFSLRWVQRVLRPL